ncbi:MAG: hypothetical protein LBB45_03310 [Methanobrevibacter sp.]|jgi:HK97 gp10 family phage protein|nr:hypothetical protein [Candidatus Methanovirga basalitermitum]
MVISVNITGLDEITQKLEEAKNNIRDTTPVMQNILDESESILKSKAPVRTGALRDSISSINMGTSGVVGDITHSIEYFPYVIYGTRPHPINHPGTKPNPFIEDSIPIIEAEADTLMSKWLTQIFG